MDMEEPFPLRYDKNAQNYKIEGEVVQKSSMAKKEYKNVVRSRLALQDGFVSLLNEGVPVHKITVSLLCARSGVNRGTFYNHYKEVIDLASEIEQDYLEEVEKAFRDIGILNHDARVKLFRRVNDIIDVKRRAAVAVAKCMPYSFKNDLQNKIEAVNRKHLSLAAVDKNMPPEILGELMIVASGIATAYGALILDKSPLTKEQIATSAVALLDRFDSKFKEN